MRRDGRGDVRGVLLLREGGLRLCPGGVLGLVLMLVRRKAKVETAELFLLHEQLVALLVVVLENLLHVLALVALERILFVSMAAEHLLRQAWEVAGRACGTVWRRG